MYTKQLLEDVNQIINPAFVRAIDFQKLNEAIENNQLINLDLLVEEAETSIKKTLMRILGRKAIPAVMLGIALLASGNASACGKNDTQAPQQKTELKTRCFTPKAVKEITAYERDMLSRVPAEDRKYFYISSAKPVLINKKPAFASSGQDDMYATRVESRGGIYYALLDTYDKESVSLIIPDFDKKLVYLLINKKQWNSKGDAITSWTLVTTEQFSKIGPITKKYLKLLEPIVMNGKSLEQKQETKLKTRGL